MNPSTWIPWYVSLILAAFLLLGAEIYVPGGILGTLGLMCLAAAVAIGFQMGPVAGWITMGMVFVFCGVGIYVWFRVFPRSRAGRRLTLASDGRAFKATDHEARSRWIGREGVAHSALRPAGVAEFDGRREDVMADHGDWIEPGTPVRVTRTAGGHLYVETIS